MNRDALNKLKRTDVQKLAKRDGVKAVGKTAAMIDNLLKKHHPLLVPYMDSIPATSEREAISRKIMRRQGMVPMAPEAAPTSVRRSPRKAAAAEAGLEVAAGVPNAPSGPVASNSRVEAEPAPHHAEDDVGFEDMPESISCAPLNRRTGRVAPQAAKTGEMSKHDEAAVVPKPATLAPPTGDVHPIPEPALARGLGHQFDRATVPSTQPNVGHAIGTQLPWASPLGEQRNTQAPFSEAVGTAPTMGTGAPLFRPPRVFFPPTQSQRAAMQERAAQMTAAADPTTQYSPLFNNALRSPIGRHRKPAARPLYSDNLTQRRAVSPRPAVHDVAIREVRGAMSRIMPLVGENAKMRDGMRELKIIVDATEKNVADLRMKAQKLQRLRIAMEQHVLPVLKSDPRVLRGTWTRPAAEVNESDAEDDEMKEVEEVEEMTSREVSEFDLP
ncbi:hypothetical protein C2E23DRAFT_882742 [Lenzites betulinus]|nr:hypothetical protein C2E23DRAFT_882742 [Lenzites betulinus]